MTFLFKFYKQHKVLFNLLFLVASLYLFLFSLELMGTSVTNTLASMTQINRSLEFQRSFAAAVVHDFFNILAVLVIFPLQYFTNFLGKAATFLGNQFQHIGGLNFLSPVKAITKPVVGTL